jgi:hypothetical protein
LVLKVSVERLVPVLEVAERVVLLQIAAARDIESEVSLHDGASSRRTHQAGNKWHPMARWPTYSTTATRRNEVGGDEAPKMTREVY